MQIKQSLDYLTLRYEMNRIQNVDSGNTSN